jgi:hypothetical protein
MSPKTSESGGGGTGGPGSGRTTVLAVVGLVLVFVFQNRDATRIRLLSSVVTVPLWTALLATAVLGMLCGAYFSKRRGGGGVE